VVLFKPYPLFATTRAEKKCAASPGGTFFILLPDLALSTQGPDPLKSLTQLRRNRRF
jgi:hypothetical protein